MNPFFVETAESLVKSRNGFFGIDREPAASTRAIAKLIELSYSASLLTEEGRASRFRLFVPSPGVAGPTKVINFDKPVPIESAKDIVRLAPVLIPGTHALSVCVDGCEFSCDGVVSFAVEDDSNMREGLFFPMTIVVSGIGGLVIRCDGPARLRLTYDFPETIVLEGLNAAETRPLRGVKFVNRLAADAGSTWVEAFHRADGGAHLTMKREVVGDPDYGISHAQTVLFQIVDDVLLQRHGGALIFCPDTNLEGIELRHPLEGVDLERLMIDYWSLCLRGFQALKSRDSTAVSELASEYFRDRLGLRSKIRGVASLANVDGCVVLSHSFKVLGFGGKITARTTKPCIVADSGEKIFEIENLGTRHQSAYHLCGQVPGTVAVVVSQDGTLRSFVGEEKCVIVAETDTMHGSGWDGW